jgi:N-acetylmuramoyl-L-alanine amidase
MVRLHWLLLSFFSIFLSSLPAQAGELLFWQFNENQNQLVFTTDEAVQPKAILISDPTRLVIDLPGTTLGQPTVKQNLGSRIRELRVGQFDNNTTRLVIELAPGYTVDPQQVRVRGTSPTQWVVELPDPERGQNPPPVSESRPPASTPNPPPQQPNPTPRPQAASGNSQFQVTRNGFFLRLEGLRSGKIEVDRSRDRRRIEFELEGVEFPSNLTGQTVAVNEYGVNQIQFTQVRDNLARVVMDVSEDSPDWQLSFSRFGGLVFIPQGALPVAQRTSSTIAVSFPQSDQNPPRSDNERSVTEIEAVELLGDSQLVIRASGEINARSQWNSDAGVYQIVIPNARLADDIRGPALGSNSPVARLRVRQPNDQTVAIFVEPANQVQIGELNQVSEQVLALQLQRSRPTSSTISQIQVPPPENPTPTTTYPSVPRGRLRVMIDPGHGGHDPGAVGIGGLREKDIILPIGVRVAQILEQQGVQAVLTRSNDSFVSLEGRVQMARRANADLFISIHANAISMSRPDVNGLETYYYATGLPLAQTIHNTILQKINVGNRGVRRARFYVLRNSPMPAVLVETGFVTGREDAAKLSNPAYREQMADAIATGILQYIRQSMV